MIAPAQIKLIAIAACAVGLFVAGWTVKGWQVDAQLLRDEQVIAKAQEGAAKAIAEIKVKNVTIRQPLEREVRENTIYTDCRNSADAMRLLNATLTNSLGSGKLPTIDPAK